MLLVLASEFTIKKGPSQWGAKIYSGGKEIAELRNEGGPEFRLLSKTDDSQWVLTNRVDGEHSRFSISVKNVDRNKRAGGSEILRVRDNIFKHKGHFYMLANNPEGKSWQHHVSSLVRYITRLDNFPHSEISEIAQNKHHQHLRQKLKRFRGVQVGEAAGLGILPRGHTVKLNDELDDIGLFVAATSYLIYASA